MVDISVLSEILRTLVVPGIGYLLVLSRRILHELRNLNGRVIRQEQWRDDHDRSDDQMFRQIRDDIDRLYDRMDYPRSQKRP